MMHGRLITQMLNKIHTIHAFIVIYEMIYYTWVNVIVFYIFKFYIATFID